MAQIEPSASAQGQQLNDAVSRILRDLKIANPDPDAVAILVEAARLKWKDEPFLPVSTTRLFLATIAVGRSTEQRPSFPAAIAQAVETDDMVRSQYEKVLALIDFQPLDAAVTLLSELGLTSNARAALESAARDFPDLPLSNAIGRSLLKATSNNLHDRFKMEVVGARAEAFYKDGDAKTALPSLANELDIMLAGQSMKLISAARAVLWRATAYRDAAPLQIGNIVSALLEVTPDDQANPTNPSAMLRAATIHSNDPTSRKSDPGTPANPSNPLTFSPAVGSLLRRAYSLQEQAFLNANIGTKGLIAALLTTPASERPGPSEQPFPDFDLDRLKDSFRDVLAARLDQPALQQWNRAFALESAGQPSLNNDQPGAGISAPRDKLGITNDAYAIADVAAGKSTSLPLAFGIFGKWGAGKSFFMRLVQERINGIVKSRVKTDGFEHAIVQIQFNAWHYAETNLWASLVGHIFEELDRWMTQDKNNASKADQILQRLATSRQLTLEAATELVQRRKDHKKAGNKLQRAQKDLEIARKAAANAPLTVWQVALEFARAEIAGDPDLKRELASVSSQLGLVQVQDDKAKIMAELDGVHRAASASSAALSGLRATIGNGRTVVLAIVALLVVPSLIYLAEWGLAAAMHQQEWTSLMHGFESLGGILAMASVLVGRFSTKANEIAGKFASLKEKIDLKIKETTVSQAKAVDEAMQDVAQRAADVENAKTVVQATGEQVAVALKEYAEETGAARIQRFVRARAGVDGYGKHLGLVSTIRKDFEQLESLMLIKVAVDEKGEAKGSKGAAGTGKGITDALAEGKTEVVKNDKENGTDQTSGQTEVGRKNGTPPDHLEQALQHYKTRVDELITRAGEDLEADERKTLQESAKSLREIDLPEAMIFRRIVLYIDDLDRCEPTKVIEVLQAVNMLLSFRLFVVMVAVDARWLLRSLEVHYPELFRELVEEDVGASEEPARVDAAQAQGGRQGSAEAAPVAATAPAVESVPFGPKRENGARKRGGVPYRQASPEDYLEKIFQIPYWVPAMDEDSSKALVRELVAGDRVGSNPNAFVARHVVISDVPRPNATAEDDQPAQEPPPSALQLTNDEIASLEAFAPYLGGSPRRARRFVNVYRVVKKSLSDADTRLLQAGTHRALATQLAIATGAPNGFGAWVALCRAAKNEGVEDEVLPFRLQDFPIDAEEKRNIAGAWEIFSADGKSSTKDLMRALADQSSRAARFSFAIPQDFATGQEVSPGVGIRVLRTTPS